MKTKICSFLAVILIVNLSCNTINKKGEGSDGEVSLEDRLVVRMNLVVLENDTFEVYYRKEDEVFGPDQKISKKIQGSEDSQDIDFAFDLLEFPSHLRIDFGRNVNQGVITLNDFSFHFNDNRHDFTAEELKKYFVPNAGLEVNFDSGVMNTKSVNDKYNPYLNSNNISYFVNKLILF